MATYVLVPYMFEEFELAVGALGKYRGAERLHNLLDSDGLSSEGVFGGTETESERHSGFAGVRSLMINSPNKAKGSHANGLELRVAAGDLKGGSKDLLAHELGHCCASVRNRRNVTCLLRLSVL